MPCACGQKVDRNQPKVLCAKCNDLFHLKCVNMSSADLDFLLTTNKYFYCNSCTLERRASIRSPPPIAVPIVDKNVEHSENSSDTSNSQHITLFDIANSMKALRSENAQILSVVNALNSVNTQLSLKCDSLFAEVRSLRELNNDNNAVISSLTSELSILRNVVANYANNTNHNVANKNNTKHMAAKQTKHQVIKTKDSNKGNTQLKEQPLFVNLSPLSPTIASPNENSTVLSSNADGSNNLVRVKSASTSAATTSTKTANAPVGTVGCEKNVELSVVGLASTTSYADVAASAGLNSASNNNASNVNKTRKAPIIVVGSNLNANLDVAVRLKWLHLSSFKPTVQTSDIVDYISTNANVSPSLIHCFKLIKKGIDSNTLSRCNFKIGISPSIYNKLLEPSIWPSDVKIRPFRFFQKEADLTAKS